MQWDGMPGICFRCFTAAMAEVDADLSGSFVHCFSAEMDEAKRNFITQVHGLDHVIFADLFDVSRPRAQDTVSGRWLTLPDFLGLGILIVGFSCKGASTLNTAMLARTDVHNIIDEMVSSTYRLQRSLRNVKYACSQWFAAASVGGSLCF